LITQKRMEINQIIARFSLSFVPIRMLSLFVILFLIVIVNVRRYLVIGILRPRFWSTIFIIYLLPVSIGTILILIPLDFVWIIFTGFEFPMNFFLFVENPIVFRVVKILFDTVFGLLFSDFIMRSLRRNKLVLKIIDDNIAKRFIEENRRTEFRKIIFFIAIIVLIFVWKAR